MDIEQELFDILKEEINREHKRDLADIKLIKSYQDLGYTFFPWASDAEYDEIVKWLEMHHMQYKIADRGLLISDTEHATQFALTWL